MDSKDIEVIRGILERLVQSGYSKDVRLRQHTTDVVAGADLHRLLLELDKQLRPQ